MKFIKNSHRERIGVCFAVSAWLVLLLGAIPGDTVWEVRQAGSDTLCGGGFSAANKGATGVDYTQQNGAKYTYTSDLSGAGTTTLTSAGSHFTNDMLGNVILITGQGSYCVTGYTSATTVTVDRNLGTFSSGTGYIGGANASLGHPGSVVVVGNTIYVKYSATAITASNSANADGGKIQLNGGSESIIGYDTNRTPWNTDANRPILNPTVNSVSGIVTGASASQIVRNLVIDGNAKTGVTAITLGAGAGSMWENIKASNVATGFSGGASGTLVTDCEANTCTTGFSMSTGSWTIRCVANACSSIGFKCAAALPYFADCLAVGCADGFSNSTAGGYFLNCTAAACTGSGFNLGGAGSGGIGICWNCLSWGTGANSYGFDGGSATVLLAYLFNCAAGNNGTANFRNTYAAHQLQNTVTLTVDPFVASGSANYALNNTAGGGAACRAVGIPGAFKGLATTTGYRDIGAVQTSLGQPGGGGMIVNPGTTGGMRGLKMPPVPNKTLPPMKKAG